MLRGYGIQTILGKGTFIRKNFPETGKGRNGYELPYNRADFQERAMKERASP